MDPTAAKYIGAGIACIGMGGAGVGVGRNSQHRPLVRPDLYTFECRACGVAHIEAVSRIAQEQARQLRRAFKVQIWRSV
jgi:hypothetical protein